MSFFSRVRPLLIVVFVPIVATFLIATPSVHAAEFEAGENVTISNRKENLYAAGSQILINEQIDKDLTVAGGTITIKDTIERNVQAAGGTISIQAPTIGGTVRIAGGDISITSTINEDLIIFGGNITITDSLIRGDLVIYGGTVTLSGSTVSGDFYGSYDDLKGDSLSSQVKGVVKATKSEEKEKNTNTNRMGGIFWQGELSVIVGLLVIGYILYRRNRLAIPSINFNKNFGWDMVWGFGILLITPIILILSLFLSLFPIITTFTGIVYLFLIFCSVLLPIYLGNLVRNVLKSSMDIRLSITLTYLLLLGISSLVIVLPIMSFLGFFVFILYVGTFGFATRHVFAAINQYVSSRNAPKNAITKK